MEAIGGHWRSLEVIGCHWRSLEVTGGHWRSLEVTGGHWRSTLINPRPVLMIKEALWMDGWDWDGMVIIGDRCSKSTFGDNKKLPI